MLTTIVDWVVRLMEILGAPGVGIAILLESVFPPIPSEVVLPLAGFTASRGELNVWAAFLWATASSVGGAFLLYWLGAAIGVQRLRQIADRMWLVESGTSTGLSTGSAGTVAGRCSSVVSCRVSGR